MTKMIKKPVSELEGAQLDWAVAKSVGWNATKTELGLTCCRMVGKAIRVESMDFRPSTEWSDGGPIIEREIIDVWWHVGDKEWVGRTLHNEKRARGPTPLIAAMRAFVASKLGDTVEVPE